MPSMPAENEPLRPLPSPQARDGHGAEAVAVLLPPPEAARVAIALWNAGEAVVPLDPAAPGRELHRSLAALRPTALIDAEGRHPLPDGVPVASGVAAVVATSGTTGEPKGVELTFSGLSASGAAVASVLGRRDWVCCLPVHLVAGLAVVGRAWTTGTPVTVLPGFDPAAIAQAAGDGAAVSLVPAMLRRLLDAAPDAAVRFGRILVGGGPTDPGLLSRARDSGVAVSTTYGMTETWGGVAHDGLPLPGVELRLGAPTGDGCADEILLRAPMLMRRYRHSSASAAIDPDGWYRTGDLGRFNPGGDGRIEIVGRRDDLVNTGGVKVDPSEVEWVLAGHPGVADVCVAGRPDPDWGQRVVAFVVPADPTAPPGLEELRSFARPLLSAPKLPREVVVLPSVPRTPGGKPLRRLLPT